MDVLSIIFACSLFADDQLVSALIHVHSNGNPNFVSDAAAIVTVEPPPDLPAAKAALAKIQAEHGRPLVGLMAVPASRVSTYGRAPEDLFNGCNNIAIGSAMLSEFAYECSAPVAKTPRVKVTNEAKRLDLRSCIVRKYALAQDHRASDYLTVFSAAVEMALRQPASHDEDPLPERSSIFPDGSDDAQAVPAGEWNSDQLFLSAGPPGKH